jgi:uncharacterized protein YkwD
MSRSIFLFIGMVIFLGAFWTARADPPAKFQMSKEEKRLFDLTNQERKKHDLPALKPSPLLFKIARAHSANMAKQHKMDHVLDGKKSADRVKAAGYRYLSTGENIAFGNYPPEKLMEAWMGSKLHRANILNKKFTEIGLGIVPDKEGVPYFTQLFGKPLR